MGEVRTLSKLLDLALLPKLFRQWRCPCNPDARVTACHANKIRALAEVIPRREIELAIQIAQFELGRGMDKVLVRPKK